MPQHYSIDQVFPDPEQPVIQAQKKQQEVEKQKLVSSPPSSLGEDISKTSETFGKNVSPFYTSPVGTQGPVDVPPQGFEGLVEKLYEGAKGIPSQMSGAYDRYKRAGRGELTNPPDPKERQPDYWDRLYEEGAHLSGAIPVVGPMIERGLLAKDTPEMLGNFLSVLPFMRGANKRAFEEVPPMMKDAAKGAFRYEPTTVSGSLPHLGRFNVGIPVPKTVAGGLGGGYIGTKVAEHTGQNPLLGGSVGTGLGIVGPMLYDAAREVKTGLMQRGAAMDLKELNRMSEQIYSKPFSKLNPSQKRSLKADLWK